MAFGGHQIDKSDLREGTFGFYLRRPGNGMYVFLFNWGHDTISGYRLVIEKMLSNSLIICITLWAEDPGQVTSLTCQGAELKEGLDFLTWVTVLNPLPSNRGPGSGACEEPGSFCSPWASNGAGHSRYSQRSLLAIQRPVMKPGLSPL